MGQTVVSPFLVELLSNEKFELYWPDIELKLDTVPHIWDCWWTKESIREQTLVGRFQCWTVGDANEVSGVVFSQIIHYPAASILQVFLAFGLGMVRNDWRHRRDVIQIRIGQRMPVGRGSQDGQDGSPSYVSSVLGLHE